MSYERINFENKPSKKTPLNADNLNKLDKGVFDAHKQISATRIISTAQGKTILTTDSANAPLVNLKAKGDTWQRQYEGHQLFDISQLTTRKADSGDIAITEVGENYIVVTTEDTYSGNGIISTGKTLREVCPNLEAGETYLITANSSGVQLLVYVGEVWNFGKTLTITEAMLNTQFYVYGHLSSDNHGDCKISDITIVKGTVKKPWEKYVGGQPSPSMAYPQPIENLENVEVKVLNGNLFDVEKAINTATGTPQDKTYFKFENGKEYTISLTSKVQNSSVLVCASTNSWNNPLQGSRLTLPSIGKLSVTFTIPSDGLEYYLYLGAGGTPHEGQYMNFWNGTYLEDFQIQLGSVATPCTPYTEQTITLTSPVPITKWDKLVNRDGIYGWSIYHLKLIVDGDDGWWAYTGYDGFAIKWLPFNTDGRQDGFCNQLRVLTSNTGLIDSNGLWIGVNSDCLYAIYNSFYDENLADKGLANFKAHLNEHPLEILTYADTEQDFIPLSDAEQEMIKSVLMNYPTTTILSNAELEVEYVADTKLYTEALIEESKKYKTLVDVILDESNSGVNRVYFELPKDFFNYKEFVFRYEIPCIESVNATVTGYITDSQAIAYARCIYYGNGGFVSGKVIRGFGTTLVLSNHAFYSVFHDPNIHSGANTAGSARSCFEEGLQFNYKDYPPYLQFSIINSTLPTGTHVVLEGR